MHDTLQPRLSIRGGTNKDHARHKDRMQALVEADLDLDAAWFIGKKAMRPLYEKAMEVIHSLGIDIEEAPKKSYMSLRRRRPFTCEVPFIESCSGSCGDQPVW